MTHGHGPAQAGDGRTDHDAWHGSADTVPIPPFANAGRDPRGTERTAGDGV